LKTISVTFHEREAPVKIFIPIAFIVTSTLLAACSGSGAIQKRVLLSQMKDLEIERTLLSKNIAGRKSKVASLEQRLYEQRSSLNEYEGKVKAYIMNHKMAVAAIAAGLGQEP
jgi:hypothetical protein